MDPLQGALGKRMNGSSTRAPIIVRLCLLAHKIVRAIALRILPQQLVNPRTFSNALLRTHAPHFSGQIINVSGWDDGDKEGEFYRNYFTKKKSYIVSNAKTAAKGFGAMHGSGIEEIHIDLARPIGEEHKGAYDVVFNHTTLEHVLNFDQAFENLCAMSRDAIIIVVPILQQLHFAEGFGDYWRPTPITVATLLYKHGFAPLVIATNDQPFGAVYLFAIGVKNPEKYPNIEPIAKFDMGEALYGSPVPYAKLPTLLESLK
ncbi:MAG: hypothetical protein WA021_05400 [Minisyncoccia bacterium]